MTREAPRIGLGTYRNTDPDQCAASVTAALELGYRHLDTAQGYDNERYVGDGLAASSVPREEVFLATKVSTDRLAYDDVLASTEKSLDRLGVDSVDLLYVHWPIDSYDPAETLRAFDHLVSEGLVQHVGLSNFTPSLLDEATTHLDAPVFAHQVEMHPLLQQRELLAHAQREDHYLVAYSPLARGEVFDVPELTAVAEKHGVSEAQVSLAWLASKEHVVPIPKATSETHLRDNYAALSLELDAEDVERIDAIDREERLVDFDTAPWNR